MRVCVSSLLLLLAACNAPPEGGLVSIDPTEPTTTDALTAVITEDAVDPNGKPVTYTYAWTVDGTAADDLTTDTVPADRTTKGEVWEVTATPSDGKKVGEDFSASVTINNSAPTVTDVAITPGDITIAGTLQAAYDTDDVDGDTVSVSLSWTVDGTEVGTGESLSAASLQKGDAVILTATPNDGETDGEPVSSASIDILNTAPTAPIAVITTVDPTPATTLVCAVDQASTDADGDSITYTGRWTVDGSDHTDGVNTTVFDGDTVSSAWTALGQEWRCIITATDGEDSVESAPSDPVTITLPPRVTYAAGYYWVIADFAATSSDHASVCASVGLNATPTQVELTWDESLMGDVAEGLGWSSAGDTGCCATAMWCYEGGDKDSTVTDGMCETHNFGANYYNYGTYTSNEFQRPVFTCTDAPSKGER